MAYFPNGSSGEVLDRQCWECPLGESACPVLAVQMIYNYDQLNNGQEKLREAVTMLVNNDGICQVRKLMLENISVIKPSEPEPEVVK